MFHQKSVGIPNILRRKEKPGQTTSKLDENNKPQKNSNNEDNVEVYVLDQLEYNELPIEALLNSNLEIECDGAIKEIIVDKSHVQYLNPPSRAPSTSSKANNVEYNELPIEALLNSNVEIECDGAVKEIIVDKSQVQYLNPPSRAPSTKSKENNVVSCIKHCRLCLNRIDTGQAKDYIRLFGGNRGRVGEELRDKIYYIFDRLHFQPWENPLVCKKCVRLIRITFPFVKRVWEVETFFCKRRISKSVVMDIPEFLDDTGTEEKCTQTSENVEEPNHAACETIDCIDLISDSEDELVESRHNLLKEIGEEADRAKNYYKSKETELSRYLKKRKESSSKMILNLESGPEEEVPVMPKNSVTIKPLVVAEKNVQNSNSEKKSTKRIEDSQDVESSAAETPRLINDKLYKISSSDSLEDFLVKRCERMKKFMEQKTKSVTTTPKEVQKSTNEKRSELTPILPKNDIQQLLTAFLTNDISAIPVTLSGNVIQPILTPVTFSKGTCVTKLDGTPLKEFENATQGALTSVTFTTNGMQPVLTPVTFPEGTTVTKIAGAPEVQNATLGPLTPVTVTRNGQPSVLTPVTFPRNDTNSADNQLNKVQDMLTPTTLPTSNLKPILSKNNTTAMLIMLPKGAKTSVNPLKMLRNSANVIKLPIAPTNQAVIKSPSTAEGGKCAALPDNVTNVEEMEKVNNPAYKYLFDKTSLRSKEKPKIPKTFNLFDEHHDAYFKTFERAGCFMVRKYKNFAKRVTRNDSLLCEICGYCAKTKSAYVNHMTVHKPDHLKVCYICGKKFGGGYALNRHIKFGHYSPSFKCNQCGKKFHFKTCLTKHVRKIHTNPTMCQCQICGKILRSSSLKIHLMRHKPSSSDVTYQCDVCQKVFLRKKALTQHRWRHFHGQNYTCPYCGRYMKYPKILQHHMRTFHEGNPDFKCSICERPFARKDVWQKHMQFRHAPPKERIRKERKKKRRNNIEIENNQEIVPEASTEVIWYAPDTEEQEEVIEYEGEEEIIEYVSGVEEQEEAVENLITNSLSNYVK